MTKQYLSDQEMADIFKLPGDELVALWWETYEIGRQIYNDQNKQYWWHITHEGNGAATSATIHFGHGKDKGRHRNKLYRLIVQAKHFILSVNPQSQGGAQ